MRRPHGKVEMRRPHPALPPLQYPVPPLHTNTRLRVLASVGLCADLRGGRAEGRAPRPVPGVGTAGCAGGRMGTGRLRRSIHSFLMAAPSACPRPRLAAPLAHTKPPTHPPTRAPTHPMTHQHPLSPSKAPRNGASIPTVATAADSRGSTSISTAVGKRCRPTFPGEPRSGPCAAPRWRPPTLPTPPSGVTTSVFARLHRRTGKGKREVATGEAGGGWRVSPWAHEHGTGGGAHPPLRPQPARSSGTS